MAARVCFLREHTRWRRGVRNGDARALRVDAARSNRASRRARVAAVKNAAKLTRSFSTQDNKKILYVERAVAPRAPPVGCAGVLR